MQILEKNIEGDVKEVAEFVKYVSTYKNKNPLILLSGGETTVKIVGSGKVEEIKNSHFMCAYL